MPAGPPGAPRTPISGDPPLDTPEQIAEALRDDPILLSTIMGNGATADIDRDLHAKLELAQYPVFIVLTRTPPGFDRYAADEELATLVHAELDQDGVYYVQTSQDFGHLAVYGDLDPTIDYEDSLISSARYDAMAQVREEIADRWGADADAAAAVEAGVVLDIAARDVVPDGSAPILTDDEVASYGATQWHSIGYHYVPDAAPISGPIVLGTALGLVLAVVAFRAIGRAVRSLGERSSVGSGHPTADPELLDLARRELADLDDELEQPRSRDVPRQRLVVAQQCRELAHGLVSAPAADPGDLDVVGLLVLVRTAQASLGRRGVGPYSCCFVNPLHGEARHRAELPGGLDIPTCAPCQRDLGRGTRPDALMERRGRLERPYYAGDTIWARTGYGALVDELWTALDRTAAR